MHLNEQMTLIFYFPIRNRSVRSSRFAKGTRKIYETFHLRYASHLSQLIGIDFVWLPMPNVVVELNSCVNTPDASTSDSLIRDSNRREKCEFNDDRTKFLILSHSQIPFSVCGSRQFHFGNTINIGAEENGVAERSIANIADDVAVVYWSVGYNQSM